MGFWWRLTRQSFKENDVLIAFFCFCHLDHPAIQFDNFFQDCQTQTAFLPDREGRGRAVWAIIWFLAGGGCSEFFHGRADQRFSWFEDAGAPPIQSKFFGQGADKGPDFQRSPRCQLSNGVHEKVDENLSDRPAV